MPNSITQRHAMWLVVLLLTVLCVACGSDDGGVSPTTLPTHIEGIVAKGPVSAASVDICRLRADGTAGDVVIGSTTDASGHWEADLPETETEADFLVVAHGGDFEDEANPGGARVPLTEMIGYLDRSQATTVAVTPYTHMLYIQARHVRDVAGIDAAWRDVLSHPTESNSFGFDLTTTLPAWDQLASENERRYAAYLSGLALLSGEDYRYQSIRGADANMRALALVEDLADGVLDGNRLDGTPIELTIDSSPVAMPLGSAKGLGPLSDSSHSAVSNDVRLSGTSLPGDIVIPRPNPLVPCSSEAARTSLENALFAVFNGPEAQSPRDVDLAEPRGLYRELVNCQPDNLDAHFAIALLDIVSLTLDSEVNAAFDAWDAYLDAQVPFETAAPGPALKVPCPVFSPDGAMDLPFEAIRRSVLPLLRLETLVNPPQLATIQDILETRVLPKVEAAIPHLDTVIDSPTYTFWVSPRMQGDLLLEEREVDVTDLLAFRAGLKALAAGIKVAISYDISLSDYTGAVLVAGLTQADGNLGRLRTGGALHLAAVPDLLRDATEDLDAAITSLFAETDPQFDDLLKIGRGDLNASELQSMQETELPMIRQSLTQPTIHTYDWDFQSSTPDVSLNVDLRSFFTSPVQDLKALLPPYSVAFDVVPYDVSYGYSYSQENVTLNAATAGYFSIDAQSSYDGTTTTRDSWDVPSWAEDQVQGIIDAEIGRIAAQHHAYVQASVHVQQFNYPYSMGPNNVTLYVDIYENTTARLVEVATVTFAATTYTDWLAQWPDPTLGGLFPDATSGAEIATAFGMREYDWAQDFSLDWAEYGMGFVGAGTAPPPPPVGP